jgi:two-component system phosphate regulon sensor histidine kinase PhoR
LPPETSEIILELNAENHFINADKVHTMNVLANLFDNAVKYSKENIYIKISTENRKKFVILQIEDAGIGIPQKHLNKIFERFYRVPTGNVHNVKGFGLGLNYVRNIAKVHDWRIYVKSEVGKGTSFILKIATN